MSTKKERQGWKRPDAFQQKVIGYFSELKDRRKEIILLASFFVLVSFVLVSWHFYSEHKRQNVREEIATANISYESEEKVAQEKRQRLQKEIVTLNEKKEKDKESASIESSKKLIAQKKKQTKEVKADHSISLKLYRELNGQHKTMAEGLQAGVRAVQILLSEKRYEEAAKLLSAISAQTNSDSFYSIHLSFIHIGVLEELNRLDEALLEIGRLKEVGDEYQAKVLLAKARIVLQQGRKPETIQILDEINEKYNTSQEARKARSLLAVLGR